MRNNRESTTLAYLLLVLGASIVLLANQWLIKGIFLLVENFAIVLLMNETIREKTNIGYSKLIIAIRGDKNKE